MCCEADHIGVGELWGALLWRLLVPEKSKTELGGNALGCLAHLSEGLFAPRSKSCYHLTRGGGKRHFDLDVVVVFYLCNDVSANDLCLCHAMSLSSFTSFLLRGEALPAAPGAGSCQAIPRPNEPMFVRTPGSAARTTSAGTAPEMPRSQTGSALRILGRFPPAARPGKGDGC